MRPSSNATYSVNLPQIESFLFLFSSGVNSKTDLSKGFPGGSVVKILPAVQETQELQFRSLGQQDPLEEGTANHSSILVWRISMDRRAWQNTVPGATKNPTQLSMHMQLRI